MGVEVAAKSEPRADQDREDDHVEQWDRKECERRHARNRRRAALDPEDGRRSAHDQDQRGEHRTAHAEPAVEVGAIGGDQCRLGQEEQDPGREHEAVDVQRVLPLTETSYDVQWSETTYDANGVKTEDAKYSGIFAVRMQPPTTAQELKENPLGIYIDTFSWSRKDQ